MCDGLAQDLGFAKADASKTDLWQDATFVLCNSTCFSDSVSCNMDHDGRDVFHHNETDLNALVPNQLIQALSATAGE